MEVALITFGGGLIMFALTLLGNTIIGLNRAQVQSIRGDAVDKFSHAASINVDTIIKLQEQVNLLETKFDETIQKYEAVVRALQNRIFQLENGFREHGWPVPKDSETTQPLPKPKGLGRFK